MNLAYEIFWGVDGKQLDLSKLKLNGILNPNSQKISPLTRGEIGCALSHLAVYKKIIELNLESALILEGDLLLQPQNTDFNVLNSGLQELPDEWELLYLGYALNNNKMSYSAQFRRWVVYPLLSLANKERFDPIKYRCRFPRDFSPNLQKAGFHYRLHSYGISKAGAKKVIEFQTPIHMAANNAVSEMCTENKLNAFHLKKRIFFQNRDLETTIIGRYNKS